MRSRKGYRRFVSMRGDLALVVWRVWGGLWGVGTWEVYTGLASDPWCLAANGGTVCRVYH